MPKIIKEPPFQYVLKDQIVENQIHFEIVTKAGKTYKIPHFCSYMNKGHVSIYKISVMIF